MKEICYLKAGNTYFAYTADNIGMRTQIHLIINKHTVRRDC